MELEELLKTYNTNYSEEIAFVKKAADERIAALEARITMLDEAVNKAYNDSAARDGVGRKGTVSKSEDPIAYIVRKAQTPDDLSAEDKALMWGIMDAALKQGMSN